MSIEQKKAERQKARDAKRIRERQVLDTIAIAVRTACDSHTAGRQQDVNEALDRIVNYLGRLRRTRGLATSEALTQAFFESRDHADAIIDVRRGGKIYIEGEFSVGELARYLLW